MDLSIPSLDGFTCLGCADDGRLAGLGNLGESGGFDYGALMKMIGGVATAAGQISAGVLASESQGKQQAFLAEQQKNAQAAQLQLAQYQAELARLQAETSGAENKAKVTRIIVIAGAVLGVLVLGGVAWKFLK